ncbi:MAG: DUF5995 family protein [Gemmatimonadetes bacterium]|nr:DUF5995 family protein [Gemmatimonadota bacterium]
MAAETIDGVLAELDAVIEQARADHHRIGCFAVLYRGVTGAVQRGIADGRFEDGARMERLDVSFANRYLDALARWRARETPSHCWQVAFDAAETWPPLILQHLLLGINAHINLDLGIAAAETAPGDALPRLRADFDTITILLQEMLDDVQERISGVSPWLWVLDRVGARRDEELFSFVLGKARQFAWRLAEQLAIAHGTERDLLIGVTDEAVTLLAKRIRSPRWFLRPVLAAVRAREPNDAARVIDVLSGSAA